MKFLSRPNIMKNGIVFQSLFIGVTGHIDIFCNEKSGGSAYSYFWNLDGKHGNIKTEYWKYGK